MPQGFTWVMSNQCQWNHLRSSILLQRKILIIFEIFWSINFMKVKCFYFSFHLFWPLRRIWDNTSYGWPLTHLFPIPPETMETIWKNTSDILGNLLKRKNHKIKMFSLALNDNDSNYYRKIYLNLDKKINFLFVPFPCLEEQKQTASLNIGKHFRIWETFFTSDLRHTFLNITLIIYSQDESFWSLPIMDF